MDTALALISLVLSVLASASSAVLWLVQYYQKKSRLKLFWSRAWIVQWRMGDVEGKHLRPITIQFAVANLSETPNSIIKVRCRLKGRDGTWIDCKPYAALSDFEHGAKDLGFAYLSTLPVNLGPKEIVRLTRFLQFLTPEGVDIANALAEPLQVEVALTDFSDNVWRAVLTKPEGLLDVTAD